MTERDYLDATNLAKARIALQVLRDLNPEAEGPVHVPEYERAQAFRLVDGWVARIERAMGVRDD